MPGIITHSRPHPPICDRHSLGMIQLDDKSADGADSAATGDSKSDKPLTFDTTNVTKRGATHFGELEDVSNSCL